MSNDFWKSLRKRVFPRPQWRVENLKKAHACGFCRVSAQVAGQEVWFESRDAELVPAPEAFLMPFLIPASDKGSSLVTDLPVDRHWHGGLLELLPIWHRWWGLDPRNPLVAGGFKASQDARASLESIFFTGGVDSFHALLCGPKVDRLTFVEGFDVALSDTQRLQQCLESVQVIGRALGKPVLSVRTNLREHPLIACSDWERVHGAALASVGYLLGDVAGSFRIASSDTGLYNVPWGSHQDTDALFSTSRVAFIHWGENVHRADKVRAIAMDTLAQKHLQVCWENRVPKGNCSQCEKCLRTMAQLSACGLLEKFTVFDSAGPWWQRIEALDTLRGAPGRVYWEDLLNRDLPPPVHCAIKALLSR